MSSERLFGLASVAVLITAIFSLVMVEGQEVEGSGSLDDDEDGLDVPSRPTRIVEEQTPTLDIFPTKTANKPSISVDREIDPIYIDEEGSGWSGSSTNIGKSPIYPHSSATPEMPLNSSDLAARNVIVTDRIASRAPQLHKKLRKVPVTAGMYVKWRIPEETFFDEEDGNTRHLRLTLRYENGTIVSDSADWIRFDVKKQVVHLLPVDENDIGRWRFVVYALDSSGQSAEDTDQNSSKRRLPGGRRLKKVMGNDVFVKSVDLKFFGACLELSTETSGRSRSSKEEGRNLGANEPFGGAQGNGNSVPVIRNDIDLINVTAGELLRYKVPEDTCFDPEDGATNRLSLQLLTMNRKELSSRSWLQFDSRNQEFVGVPLEEEVGREEYQLVCSDRNGLSVIDGIVVAVLNRPFSERFGVEFVLEFAESVELGKVDIVEGLAQYFGDSSASNVILKSVSEHKVVWLNKTLAYAGCDDPEISYMRSKLMSPKPTLDDNFYRGNGDSIDRDGGVLASDSVLHHFDNMGLINAYLVLRGSCILTIPHDGDDDFASRGGGHGLDDHNFHGIIPSGDYLMTFLVPAVIITLMLLMAILLALVLHRKRRAGKLNLFYSAESLPPRVPVILQDELVDVDANSYQKRTVVAAAAPAGQIQPNAEFDRLIMPHNRNNVEVSQRPTPAYQFRQT